MKADKNDLKTKLLFYNLCKYINLNNLTHSKYNLQIIKLINGRNTLLNPTKQYCVISNLNPTTIYKFNCKIKSLIIK